MSESTLSWPTNHPFHSCLSPLMLNLCKVNRQIIRLLIRHGPLARYVKLWVVHAPGMPGTFSSSPRVSDPDMHHSMCVTHALWCVSESLTSGSLWSRWRGKRSRYSRRMHNPQFYVSGKRPIVAGEKVIFYGRKTSCGGGLLNKLH